jgi:hypothetical protein
MCWKAFAKGADEQSGVYGPFRTHMNELGDNVNFIRYRHNRCNIFFLLGHITYHHRHNILNFLVSMISNKHCNIWTVIVSVSSAHKSSFTVLSSWFIRNGANCPVMTGELSSFAFENNSSKGGRDKRLVIYQEENTLNCGKRV